MRPNIQRDNLICPGIPGTPHPAASPCRFVLRYRDGRGWKYKVMSGLGGVWKARYQRPDHQGSVGWKGLAAVPWRNSFDEAQADLNRLAEEKGWSVWEEENRL